MSLGALQINLPSIYKMLPNIKIDVIKKVDEKEKKFWKSQYKLFNNFLKE